MSVFVSEVIVPTGHPALPGHFPDRAIVPAAWILTLVGDACSEAFAGTTITGVAHARFRSPLTPGVAMRIEIERRDGGGIGFACTGPSGRIADGLLTTGMTE